MYSRALAVRPDAAGIWRVTGIAPEKLDELENAHEAFARACELEADYGPSWVDLGNVLLRQERYAEALSAGQRAMDLMPEHPAGYGLAGRASMRKENPQAALPLLEKCAQLAATTPTWKEPAQEWLDTCRQRVEEE